MRILEFFGVPAEFCSQADLAKMEVGASNRGGYAILASAETLAAARSMPEATRILRSAEALYIYASDNRSQCQAALTTLVPQSPWRITPAPTRPVSVQISRHDPAVMGTMSSLTMTAQLTDADSVLVPLDGAPGVARTLISADGAALFAQLDFNGIPLFFCASAAIVDVDAPVRRNYYDVKNDVATAVPLLCFIKWAFSSVTWRPRELGACLIIDDPLLKHKYGCCDFAHLRRLMTQHGFTTNVAFIPWNWRRTSASASDFFRNASSLFSVSVHGCDHVAGEFGAVSLETIESAACLAQARMRKHQARTRIQHDPIMVFPQGIFSSICPSVLKGHGFAAAVNTEISPGDGADGTPLRDVWDVAILRYGCFPIFTRRYADHGLENFAFDLMLGKPCFIVAHHGFFSDDGARLIDLIEKLRALGSDLNWRSPFQVIRRSCRWRPHEGLAEYEMYANELVLDVPSRVPTTISIRKRETDVASIADVRVDGRSVLFQAGSGYVTLQCDASASDETVVSVHYLGNAARRAQHRSPRRELAVAARRLLSEMRDEYLERLRLRSLAQ